MRKTAILCVLLIATTSGTLGAQSAADKATAQALFDAAKRLLAEGKYAESCSKFAESQRLDPAPGTLLNLADCYEKSGLTASAWATWLEAAAATRQAGQTDRERAARDRAAALKSRLVSITIVVPDAHRIANLEVRRDGTMVGIATWGTAVPVDPGTHQVVASAPGRRSWQTTVTVVDGVQPVQVTVPRLESEPATVAPPAVAPATVTPPAVAPGQAMPGQPAPGQAMPGQPAPGQAMPGQPGPGQATPAQPSTGPSPDFAAQPAAPAPATPVGQDPEAPGATQRTWAYVAGGVGIVGIAVGSFYGLRAKSKNKASIAKCSTETLCNQEGYDLRQDALSAATYSTIAFGLGSAALVTGVVLLLTAPTTESGPEPAQARWTIDAGFSRSSGQITVKGAF